MEELSNASLFLILSTLYKIHNETSLLSYFSVKKSTKSHLRGLSSLLKNSFRVHKLVAQAMRGKCVRQIAERKPAVLPLLAISTISRVRTCHTRKPSRFVHALSARPLKKEGRAWVEPVRRRDRAIISIDTSSVSLRLTPSPTGEGLSIP